MDVSAGQLSRMDEARMYAAGSNWPRIASRPARQLVRAAFHCCGSLEIRRRYPDSLPLEVLDMDPRAKRHQQRIKRLLRRSDLAARLPAGLDLLPDIYAAHTPFWSALLSTFRPRNYRQLARHMISNLEWYLEPNDRPLPPFDWVFNTFRVCILSIYVVMLFFLHSPYAFMFWLPIVGIGIAEVVNQQLAQRRYGKSAKLLDIRYRRWINAAELYYYLAEAYSDVEDAVDR